MAKQAEMFPNKALLGMIIPVFLEQFLVMLVGLADIAIVSYAGEAAVSGVSLVNQFNTVFIYLFTALASGGSVVISQYIGRKDYQQAGEAASQLLLFSVIFAVGMMGLVLESGEWLLQLLFGKVEDTVMAACLTYLRISAYSYPLLAVYNAGAAIYRSLGKNSVIMYVSAAANIINIVGNIWGVLVLHAGVAGVAWASFAARAFSAVLLTGFGFFANNAVVYQSRWLCRLDRTMMKRVLHIAIPNGLENGIFQLVKVALSSIVALFGTWQIAANGVAQSIWSLAALAGVAMGPVFITVIGQCMGNGDTKAAEYYLIKLTKMTLAISVVWNGLVFLLTPVWMSFYDLAIETKQLVIWLVLIHNVFNAVAFPFSGALSNGLRAAGDVKFTMIISIASTLGVRLLLSYVLGVVWQMGAIGLAVAMACDWLVRAWFFIRRQQSGKWKGFSVIAVCHE